MVVQIMGDPAVCCRLEPVEDQSDAHYRRSRGGEAEWGKG